jgi:hypothetical protein
MKEGFPRFTELFAAFLVLDICASVIYGLHLLLLPSNDVRDNDVDPKKLQLKIQISYRCFCIVCNAMAYLFARKRGESLTLSLNAMLSVYNFLEGTDYVSGLLRCVKFPTYTCPLSNCSYIHQC